jgi:ribosome-binding protein aMBF1 (putative translation factor)
MLVWARKRAGFSVRSAAGKLKQEESRIEEWEAGDRQPTLVQARRMAEV